MNTYNKDIVFVEIKILKSKFPRKILNKKLVNVDTYVSVRNKLSLCYLITIFKASIIQTQSTGRTNLLHVSFL